MKKEQEKGKDKKIKTCGNTSRAATEIIRFEIKQGNELDEGREI